MKSYILAIDQGTSGTTVILFNQSLNVQAKATVEFKQYYPKPSWVEHDGEEIWSSVLKGISAVLKQSKINPTHIAAIGITNQRETTLIWDKKTHALIHPAIVWQDRRTLLECEKLKKKGLEKEIHQKTGLLLDPYFSATKISYILNQVPGAKIKAKNGHLAFGTIDTFLLWRLSAGLHLSEVSNASRTLLMNLKQVKWDEDLLKLFKIPSSLLGDLVSSSEIYGKTKNVPGLPDGIPIAGIAGDQQAALFGQACFKKGEAKCTYGTGSFILMNTGTQLVLSKHQLLSTVAWKIKNEVNYAIEGSAFMAGAAVAWLKDGLKIISSSQEVESLAKKVSDCGGVYFVPAFTGLGAPYWLPDVQAAIVGLTRGSTHAHIARACLEGVALLQYDILQAMIKDLGAQIKSLKVDGGAAQNNLLMQFQADLLRVRLKRPAMLESTALGAAALAGLGIGLWKSPQEIEAKLKMKDEFKPQMSPKKVKEKIEAWRKAVHQTLAS